MFERIIKEVINYIRQPEHQEKIIEILEELKRRGYKTAIYSNFPKVAIKTILPSKVKGYIDFLFYGKIKEEEEEK